MSPIPQIETHNLAKERRRFRPAQDLSHGEWKRPRLTLSDGLREGLVLQFGEEKKLLVNIVPDESAFFQIRYFPELRENLHTRMRGAGFVFANCILLAAQLNGQISLTNR